MGAMLPPSCRPIERHRALGALLQRHKGQRNVAAGALMPASPSPYPPPGTRDRTRAVLKAITLRII